MTTVAGLVFDIQRFCIHDGPGIRTTVFLKGCPLRCPWCHNPESVHRERELFFHGSRCLMCGRCVEVCEPGGHVVADGMHRLDRSLCVRCFRCVEACPAGALELVGREMRADQVMETVLRDQAFYRESGGGVTVSGGEPMMQFEFTRALLQAAKDAHLHTCLETCGVAAGDRYCQVLPLVDLFLWDLKDTDAERLRRTAQAPLETIVENLRRVDAAGAKTLLRCLMIPGYNFEESHLAQIAELVRSLGNCLGAELLAYHRLGTSKRELLGLDDSTLRFEPPSEEQMAWARGFLRDRGVGVGRSSQVVE